MNRLLKWTDHLEEAILTVTMIVMTLAVAAQILCRYVFTMPLDWSEEMAQFCFVWCIYMGASYACMNRKHLKIDAALFLFPKSWRLWVEFLGKVLFLVFAVIVVLASWQHFDRITFVRPQLSPAMRIPMGVAYSAIPLSFGLIIVRLLQDMYRFVRNKEYRQTDILARIAREELSAVTGVEGGDEKAAR